MLPETWRTAGLGGRIKKKILYQQCFKRPFHAKLSQRIQHSLRTSHGGQQQLTPLSHLFTRRHIARQVCRIKNTRYDQLRKHGNSLEEIMKDFDTRNVSRPVIQFLRDAVNQACSSYSTI